MRHRTIFLLFSIITLSSLYSSLSGLRSTKVVPISGKVVSEGELISFARVRIKATENFTITGYDGRFLLYVPDGGDSLLVTGWAKGHFNGEAKVKPGDTSVIIQLNPLYEQDNPNYQWLSPEKDPDKPTNCGNCHAPVLMEQWQHNAHGQAAVNPFFHAMYYGKDQAGTQKAGVGYKLDFEQTQGNCATCHIPGVAVANPWGVDPKSVTGVGTQGIFCDFCHKIKGVRPSSGQGTTGVLSIDLLRPPEGKQIFFGPYDDIHEPDSYLPLIRKSAFCASCHTGKFWGTEVYNSFNEWKESPYSDLGIQCQHCHMKPDGITTNFAPGKGGVERHPLSIPSHTQPGSRDPEILRNALTLQLHADQITDTVLVRVVLYNDQTGHHVPTDRPSRNMILLVRVVDEQGAVLEQIGGTQVPTWGGIGDSRQGNYAGLPGKGYAKILEDFEGNSPAPSWRPGRILYDNRIAAFAADTSYYFFKAPTGMHGLTVEAQLLYRRFFKTWMNEKDFEIEDIIMESDTFPLQSVLSSPDQVVPLSLQPELTVYPNPCQEAVRIGLRLPYRADISLILYDQTGREVSHLVAGRLQAGFHHFPVAAWMLVPGVYFCRLSIETGHSQTIQFIKY